MNIWGTGEIDCMRRLNQMHPLLEVLVDMWNVVSVMVLSMAVISPIV